MPTQRAGHSPMLQEHVCVPMPEGVKDESCSCSPCPGQSGEAAVPLRCVGQRVVVQGTCLAFEGFLPGRGERHWRCPMGRTGVGVGGRLSTRGALLGTHRSGH